MLNYDPMKQQMVKRYVVLVVLVAMFSACSGTPENGASSNANAPNSNSAQSPQLAQPGTPLAVQPMPPPTIATAETPKPSAERNANTVTAATGRAPKLVAPDKKLDFGKQPQDKTLVRAIAIRNGGREDLKIESVAPS